MLALLDRTSSTFTRDDQDKNWTLAAGLCQCGEALRASSVVVPGLDLDPLFHNALSQCAA